MLSAVSAQNRVCVWQQTVDILGYSYDCLPLDDDQWDIIPKTQPDRLKLSVGRIDVAVGNDA